ncbi:hypothetical protein HYH02_004656 [Chlamydomonas schloesseri]|uniref:3-dehydrosphinganine reductase n=1 Tax=Chlamydomonas schloesseri TaxID=2026947 RepID=A0A835WNQ3_9CHLO|nr:hypothetical protein HYH02_004656 [Chlamydomonas schloesseri]|eukprot:KAG2450821.1 hypothetical protein HYH02_004656 [Chlamydomonas schloesseri]
MFGKKLDLTGQHALITGGSTGIGLALAAECVRAKANVTVVARTEATLKAAKAQLEELAQKLETGGRVTYQAVDVTDAQKVAEGLAAAVQELGPVDLLICNAGSARCGYFHELELPDFGRQMQVNYFGVLHVVHALYGDLVRRNQGHIVIVGSALSTFGMVGYSAYCPSKYAVKGLADCLRNELQGTRVKVSFAQPPDTDTPGFAEENKSKPPETKEISEGGSTVYKPDKVAACLMSGIRSGAYLLPNPDPGLAFLAMTTQGLLPRSFPGVLLELLAALIAPFAQWGFAAMFDRVARKFAPSRFKKLWGGMEGAGGKGAGGAKAALGSASGSGAAGAGATVQ